MKDLVQKWQNEYSWREEEAKMNEFDQYLIEIEDFEIYFIHSKSPNLDAIPLIFVHGWRKLSFFPLPSLSNPSNPATPLHTWTAGTSHDFLDIIPLLAHPRDGQ